MASGSAARVQTQKNPPGGGLHVDCLWFVRIDLVRAQLHLPGSCRMMMMVHVVETDEHLKRG